jgi:pimeloyl-ACP methyl ester carboxylesterase
MDSPDQNANGLPATVTLEGNHVRISAQGAAGSFDGAFTADGAGLAGQWSGAPTTFTRMPPGASVAALDRPQTPVKPYPYREDLVTYAGGADTVRIAGTLTIPQGNGPFPAVLLIAGSGPQTRDESIYGHAVFLVLADTLTRHGIAVLRYDKRGLGQSTGDYAGATSTDFAADAVAGVDYLRARQEIDEKWIGLIGHSEGGLIAPMVAERDPTVGFLVLMAGPAVPGDQIIMAQTKAIAAAAGAADAELAADAAIERRFLDAVMSAKDANSAERAVREVLKGAGMPDAAVDAQARAAASNWYRFFLSYDPGPALGRMKQPVLAVIGSNDLQVPADLNLPALRSALKSHRDATVVELPGLNHLFQTAKTGAPSEYGEINETISPTALDLITRWILDRARAS